MTRFAACCMALLVLGAVLFVFIGYEERHRYDGPPCTGCAYLHVAKGDRVPLDMFIISPERCRFWRDDIVIWIPELDYPRLLRGSSIECWNEVYRIGNFADNSPLFFSMSESSIGHIRWIAERSI